MINILDQLYKTVYVFFLLSLFRVKKMLLFFIHTGIWSQNVARMVRYWAQIWFSVICRCQKTQFFDNFGLQSTNIWRLLPFVDVSMYSHLRFIICWCWTHNSLRSIYLNWFCKNWEHICYLKEYSCENIFKYLWFYVLGWQSAPIIILI